jgi:hypothetical protein
MSNGDFGSTAVEVDKNLGAFADILQGMDNVGESELQVGMPPLVRFDHNVVKLTGVEAREQPFGENELEARFVFTIEKSIQGNSPGRMIGDYFTLAPRKQTWNNASKEMVDATPAELKQYAEEHYASWQRLVRVLGLKTFAPNAKTVDAVKMWAETALGAKVIVAAYTRNGFDRIIWDSLRKHEDVVDNPRKKGEKMTAIERAEAEIKFAEERAAKKRGGARGAGRPSAF